MTHDSSSNTFRAATAALLMTATPALAEDKSIAVQATLPMPMRSDLAGVTPALIKYADEKVLGQVWNRPGLDKRDRAIATVSALIARGATAAMPFYLNRALDYGVTPRELSEIITHLAFYSGFPNAMASAGVAKAVFMEHGIGPDQLPAVNPELLPLDLASDDKRVALVAGQFENVSPQLLQDTTDVLFRDLWLRPDLAPRDRSLVTVSALIAAGQTAQVTPHLNKAMDNGLKQPEAAELVAHLAFYVGWPNAFSAMSVMKGVFEGRAK